MIKKVSWTFGEDMKGNTYSLGNKISFFKGQWEGFMFSIQGLRLSKAEKALGLTKKDVIGDAVTIYFLRWGITLHRNNTTFKDHLRLVEIVAEQTIL